jgi:hypothetical protein
LIIDYKMKILVSLFMERKVSVVLDRKLLDSNIENNVKYFEVFLKNQSGLII